MDAAGNVYVINDGSSRLLKLPAGSDISVGVPLNGLKDPLGLAVGTVGNVYVVGQQR